jgi:hypothetical protein
VLAAKDVGRGPDQGHVAADHVDQLGQLVEARPSEESPHPRDPRVVGDLEVRRGQHAQMAKGRLERLRVADHRTELVHRKSLAVTSRPLLREHNRSRRVDGDGHGAGRGKRQDEREAGHGQGRLEDSLPQVADWWRGWHGAGGGGH